MQSPTLGPTFPCPGGMGDKGVRDSHLVSAPGLEEFKAKATVEHALCQTGVWFLDTGVDFPLVALGGGYKIIFYLVMVTFFICKSRDLIFPHVLVQASELSVLL